MTQIDIDALFRKFAELDVELKQLRKEVGEMKWYAASQTQHHGTTGAVAYSATASNSKSWLPQWEENLSDNEKFDGEFK